MMKNTRAENSIFQGNRQERLTPWVDLKYFTYSPAVYPRMLGEASRDARTGGLIHVYDKNNEYFGTGFYNPKAHVPLRIFRHSRTPVGEEYFESAIRKAVELRTEFLDLDSTTEAYRVFNSDGDGISGLIVDRYRDALSIEISNLGCFERVDQWIPLFHKLLGTSRAQVHMDNGLAKIEGIPMRALPHDQLAPIRFRENGVRFEVNFTEGHKTGFFCDQRDNRKKFATFCKDKTVLDLCCYTGGFAISAALAGASDVTAVDLDEKAIEQAKRNGNLNQLRIKWTHADAFSYARQMQKNGAQFDVVMLDPPKLVEHRDRFDEGVKKYRDLNTLGLSLVKDGGIFVTCSCSGLLSMEDFEKTVIAVAHRQDTRLQFLDRTGPGSDHPVYSNCLEGRYLKVLWSRVVR